MLTPATALGRAVQVPPIKPTSKAPGNKRLKVKYDETLSIAAFKFNLRRYSSAARSSQSSSLTASRSRWTETNPAGCGSRFDALMASESE